MKRAGYRANQDCKAVLSRVLPGVLICCVLVATAMCSLPKQLSLAKADVVRPTNRLAPPLPATVTSVAANWGIRSAAFVSGAVLPWQNITSLSITLNEPAALSAGDVSVTGVTVANYGPVTISGSGTAYTITLAQPLSASDRITLTIGNAQIETDTLLFGVLTGDINGDGTVNAQDLVLARNAFGTSNALADINGDGTVNITDYNIVRGKVGTELP